MSGAGNDFVLVDNRENQYHLKWEHFARVSCNRRFGIGADGVLILEPSTVADFRMLYFNADGSSGGMCGNGGRCAAAFVMRERGDAQLHFDAMEYIYQADRSGEDVKLQMMVPTSIQLKKELRISDSSLSYHYVNTGSPHVVIFMDELPSLLQSKLHSEGIESLGRAIRLHPHFLPGGTNVNFIKRGMNESIEMRTYERGVEAETLACGTGAVACSVITALLHDNKPPITVKTRSEEILMVNFRREGERTFDVELIGSARFVFTGEIIIDEDYA